MELFYQKKQDRLDRRVQSIQFLRQNEKKREKVVREVRVCDSKMRCRKDIIVMPLSK